MRDFILPIYFGLGIFAIIYGVLTYRNQKRSEFFKDKLEAKRPMPWWYYIGGAIAAFLVLGPFDYTLKLMGHILFFVFLGLGISWKLRHR